MLTEQPTTSAPKRRKDFLLVMLASIGLFFFFLIRLIAYFFDVREVSLIELSGCSFSLLLFAVFFEKYECEYILNKNKNYTEETKTRNFIFTLKLLLLDLYKAPLLLFGYTIVNDTSLEFARVSSEKIGFVRGKFTASNDNMEILQMVRKVIGELPFKYDYEHKDECLFVSSVHDSLAQSPFIKPTNNFFYFQHYITDDLFNRYKDSHIGNGDKMLEQDFVAIREYDIRAALKLCVAIYIRNYERTPGFDHWKDKHKIFMTEETKL
jgi:hypothetical protein